MTHVVVFLTCREAIILPTFAVAPPPWSSPRVGICPVDLRATSRGVSDLPPRKSSSNGRRTTSRTGSKSKPDVRFSATQAGAGEHADEVPG